MRSCPRGFRRSVDRGAHRPAIEPRKSPFLGADAVHMAEGNTSRRVIASARTTRRGQRPWHVRTLLAREPGDLASDRSANAAGPHREGEEPKPMMHAREKSDSAIVAGKPTNNAVTTAAEPVERRAGTKGNANQQSTDRAQNRATASQALERIRRVAQAFRRHSPKVGAVCGSPARTDLSGGRSAMAVPTALPPEFFRA
jgi:hypothetical protein